MKLLLILVLILSLPLLELFLMIQSGSAIGSGPTMLLIAVSALLGSYALRVQGMHVLAKMQRATQYGVAPLGGMLESIFILIGGTCLILPGFITDIVGICCLIPMLRRYVLFKAIKLLF